MNVYAIADLHLSHSGAKPMDVFGPAWTNHTERIRQHWQETGGEDDLVLLPGDISWAMTLEDAMPDLEWIHRLPGTKVMTKGNHDYWWKSVGKVRAALPDSIRIIQNDALLIGDVALAGTRLWQLPWVTSAGLPLLMENPPNVVSPAPKRVKDPEEEMKYVRREMGRLEMSLKKAATLGGRQGESCCFQDGKNTGCIVLIRDRKGNHVEVFDGLLGLDRQHPTDFTAILFR